MFPQIISYCCGTYPNIGGVPRYDTQLKLIFPNRVFFEGPKEKDRMLSYLKTCNNPIIITDNHLSLDIPNEYLVFIVNHGPALTYAERDPNWDPYWRDLCCNGQKIMLDYRNPDTTRIIQISTFCIDESKRWYPERIDLFKNIFLPHSSELDTNIYKTSFHDKPVILGNWSNSGKGSFIIPALKEYMQEYTFTNLYVYPKKRGEQLVSFNKRKQEIYVQSDIYLQLSVCEGYSYSAIDALLCGLVVIATDTGLFYKDVPEDCFVKLDWTKLHDKEYMKERIQYGWDNREVISKKGREWFLQNHSFIDWQEKMKQLII